MKCAYTVTVAERERSATVEALPDGRLLVVLDGREMTVDVARAEGEWFSLIVDGASHDVLVQRADHGWFVMFDGLGAVVRVEDERARTIRTVLGKSEARSGSNVLAAPMPGLVTAVLVAPGQRVSAGSGLIVVEAMKMENELRAPRECVVSEVLVSRGTTVERGQTLVVLDQE